MLSSVSHPNPGSAATTHPPPTKANLKAWWNHFNFVQKTKKEVFEGPYRAHDTAEHPVFGKPLKDSLRYASVQISTADANGDLYVWGYIPVVVAKCGLHLKETATEVPGTFRVNGSNKRMRDLQAAFETPPRYGKSLDWKNETYTTHDVASVFRRYLTQMPEPVIPYDMYHLFRDALNKQPLNQEEVISTYKALIRRMPRPNQYLLLYVLDLLSVFARKSDKNLMTATNLAVIFRPGIIAHPEHEMSPHAHALSQKVLEFLIAQQDWFIMDIIPPAPPGGIGGDDQGEGSGQGGAAGGPAGSGGAGPSGKWGGAPGGGGSTGKWREGTSTPTRRGTMDSAEGGPSTPRATTTRQRVISGGPDVGTWHGLGRSSGSTPAYGHPSPINSPSLPHRTGQQTYQYPSQAPPSPSIPQQHQSRHTRPPAPEQQHSSYFSPKHGNNYSNSTLKPNTIATSREAQRQQQPEPQDTGGDSSVFATPMSSMPPSPVEGSASGHAGPSSSGHSHSKKQSSHNDQQYQQYLNSTRYQEEQQLQRQKPSKLAPSAYHAAPLSSNQLDPSARNMGAAPIHTKYAHTDPHPNGNIAPPQRIPLPLQMPPAPPLLSRHSTQSPSHRHSQQPTHSHSYPQQLEQLQKRSGHSSIPPSPASASFPPYGYGPGYASASPHGSGTSDVDDVMVVPWSAEDDGWSVVSKGYVTTPSPGAPGGFMALGGGAKEREQAKEREKQEKQRIRAMRRKTAMDRSEFTTGDHDYTNVNNISPILESPPDTGGLVRSRTLPSRRKNGDVSLDKENAKTGSSENTNYHLPLDDNAKEKFKDRERSEKRVLKKQRRVSAANRAAA